MIPLVRASSLRAAARATIACALVVLCGCARESDVLARVGGRTITRDDFEMMARALASRYPGPPDSAKVHLLRDIVDRELLVQGAIAAGFHRDTTFLDFNRRSEEQLLRQRFYDALGVGDAVVSDAEVRTLHDWRAIETQAQVVFTFSRPMAEGALAQIESGADFGQVADRFNPPGFAPPGGDIGYVQPGMLQLPVDDLIRTAPVGKVLGPVEAVGQGWFIIRVKDRRKAAAKPLQAETPMLEQILRQRKQRQILVNALDRLRGDYHVKVERGATRRLIQYVVPPSLQGISPPPLSMLESSTTLATYDGGTYTMGDALEDLRAGASQRPSFNVQATVERWIEMRTLERAALIEARRRQLGDDPDLQRALRERSSDYLLDGYVRNRIIERATATEADARALFDQSGMKPERLAQARFLVAVLRDSASAAQLAATAPQTQGLREAVSAAALGLAVRQQTVSYPSNNPMWAALEPAFMSTNPGGYTPPIAVAGLWVVAQLQAKNVVPQTFESLPADMRTMLENQARETKRGLLLAALTDSLRRAMPVEIHWERLRRVPWPEAFAFPGTQG